MPEHRPSNEISKVSVVIPNLGTYNMNDAAPGYGGKVALARSTVGFTNN